MAKYQLSKTVLTSQLYGKMFHQAVVRVHQLDQVAKQVQAVSRAAQPYQAAKQAQAAPESCAARYSIPVPTSEPCGLINGAA